MWYNPYDKQRDERFPERESECARDDERNDNSSSDIYDGNIEHTVYVSSFSWTTEYVFILTQVDPEDSHIDE